MSQRHRLFRSRRARQDLIDIWDHIAADNQEAADTVLDCIDKGCLGLLDHLPPRAGAR